MGMRGHRRARKAAAATAVVCALGVGALAGATSASATDQLWVGGQDLTLPSGVTDPAGAEQLHLRVTHDGDGDLAPATVTVDTSGLAGVADVVWPKQCTHTGAVGTCTVDVQNLAVESDPAKDLSIGLNAAAGAKDGDHGSITYKGRSGNVTGPEQSSDISVGSGADLVLQPLKSVKDVKVGSTVTEHVVWKNTGNQSAQQTLVVLHTMVGVELPQRFSNCVYGEPAGGGKDATAVCTIDTPLAPGQTLQLSSDVAYKVTSEAWTVYSSVKVLPPGAEADAVKAGVHGTAGTGPELTATLVPASRTVAPPTAELNPDDNFRDFSIRADNHAHYYAIGDQAKGDKGDTVPVTVGLGNEGPATIFDMSGGEAVDSVKVTFPKGTTVTKIPDGCGLMWKTGVKGHGPYECRGAIAQPAGYKRTFTFQVRLDDQLVDARGTAALTNQFSEMGGAPVSFPWDDSTKGYTQPIVFNGPATPTATASANAPGTDSGSATQAGQSSSGELAATGASSTTPLLAGGAALLLAAGGAVTLAARRRSAARR